MKIDQATREHLNPAAGTICSHEELAPAGLKDVKNVLQKREFSRLRPIISVAKYYRETKLIEFSSEQLPKQTIKEYYTTLKDTFLPHFPNNENNKDLFEVFAAETIRGEEGIAIQIPEAIFYFLKTTADIHLQVEVKDKKLGSVPNDKKNDNYVHTLVDLPIKIINILL